MTILAWHSCWLLKPRTLSLPLYCSALSSSLLPLHPLAPCWLTSLLTGWRIVATTAQLNVGEAGEVLITKEQAASEAFSFTRSALGWGGGRQEVARLTGQPFNYAVKHGQRPGSAAAKAAAEAAVKPGTSKVIATAERWKGRSTTTHNNNSERGWAGVGGGVAKASEKMKTSCQGTWPKLFA